MTIKEARTKVGLTQQAMSDLLKIPKRTIEDWETSKRTPPEYVESLIIEKLEKVEKGRIKMTLNKTIENIMKEINFDELRTREYENGCDFNSTLKSYKDSIKSEIKERSEFWEDDEFSLLVEDEKAIIDYIQNLVDNDFSCMGE